MATDTTSLQIRIAVLETQLQHANEEKVTALSSAQQTISTLTAIILHSSQSQRQGQIQRDQQKPFQTQSHLGSDLLLDNIHQTNVECQIEQLRQQLQSANLENKSLKTLFRQAVHGKAAKIANRYATVKSHEEPLHQGDESNQIKGNEAEAEIETGQETYPHGQGFENPLQDKDESFGSLIGEEFSNSTTSFVAFNVTPQNTNPEKASVDSGEIGGTTLENDFQPLEDVLGPEAGVHRSGFREVERQRAPLRYRRGFWNDDIRDSGFKRDVFNGYEGRNIPQLPPTELQYGDDPVLAKPKPKAQAEGKIEPPSNYERLKTQEKLESQSGNKNACKEKESPLIPSVIMTVVTPKLSILKTEESMERPFAGGTYEHNPNKCVDRERDRDRNCYREPRPRRRIVAYADEDYAPPQHTGARITQHQRALEQYDFTPSEVPEFGSVLPDVSVPTVTKPAPLPFPNTSPSSKGTDRPFETTVFTKEEWQASVQIHASSIGPGDSVFPIYFRHGLHYKPEQGDTNYLRTVHIGNLPADISMRTLLSHVRGGAVLSAVICNTIKLTGGVSALIVFIQGEAAAQYAAFANEYGLSFSTGPKISIEGERQESKVQKAIFTVLNTPTWPMQTNIVTHGHTRVLRISNLPGGMNCTNIKYELAMGDELVDDEIDKKGRLLLAFSSERAAGRATARLKSWRVFAGAKAEFGEDSCAGPLSDLLAPEVKHAMFNEDEIEIDDEESQEANVVGKSGNNGEAGGETNLDWADEMNELAAENNSVVIIGGTETMKGGEYVVLPKQSIRKPRGLAGRRYSTLVPGY